VVSPAELSDTETPEFGLLVPFTSMSHSAALPVDADTASVSVKVKVTPFAARDAEVIAGLPGLDCAGWAKSVTDTRLAIKTAKDFLIIDFISLLGGKA
jgi:hypothetical protein